LEAGAPNNLAAAFGKIAGERVEKVVMLADPTFCSERRRIWMQVRRPNAHGAAYQEFAFSTRFAKAAKMLLYSVRPFTQVRQSSAHLPAGRHSVYGDRGLHRHAHSLEIGGAI